MSKDQCDIDRLRELLDEARQIACFYYAQKRLGDDLEADVADKYRQDLEEFCAAIHGWDCWRDDAKDPFVGDNDHGDYPYPAGNTDG